MWDSESNKEDERKKLVLYKEERLLKIYKQNPHQRSIPKGPSNKPSQPSALYFQSKNALKTKNEKMGTRNSTTTPQQPATTEERQFLWVRVKPQENTKTPNLACKLKTKIFSIYL